MVQVVVVDDLSNSVEESLNRVRELTGCDDDQLIFRKVLYVVAYVVLRRPYRVLDAVTCRYKIRLPLIVLTVILRIILIVPRVYIAWCSVYNSTSSRLYLEISRSGLAT